MREVCQRGVFWGLMKRDGSLGVIVEKAEFGDRNAGMGLDWVL